MSLFANAAGIMPEIVIGMKSFVFLALAIIAGILIINLMPMMSVHWDYISAGHLRAGAAKIIAGISV